jgi:hypothetical protein
VAGVVGITPLPNGRYLMVITGGTSNHSWFFYRSNVNDLSRTDLTWEQVRTPLGPETHHAHQTLNFLREGSIEGDLYIASARGAALNRDRSTYTEYALTETVRNRRILNPAKR